MVTLVKPITRELTTPDEFARLRALSRDYADACVSFEYSAMRWGLLALLLPSCWRMDTARRAFIGELFALTMMSPDHALAVCVARGAVDPSVLELLWY